MEATPVQSVDSLSGSTLVVLLILMEEVLQLLLSLKTLPFWHMGAEPPISDTDIFTGQEATPFVILLAFSKGCTCVIDSFGVLREFDIEIPRDLKSEWICSLAVGLPEGAVSFVNVKHGWFPLLFPKSAVEDEGFDRTAIVCLSDSCERFLNRIFGCLLKII